MARCDGDICKLREQGGAARGDMSRLGGIMDMGLGLEGLAGHCSPAEFEWSEVILARFMYTFAHAALWRSAFRTKRCAMPLVRLAVWSRFGSHARTLPRSIAVHVRCSDVPFCRDPNYMLATCPWYNAAIAFAMAKVKGPSPEEIIVVSCHNHAGTRGSLNWQDGRTMAKNRLECEWIVAQYMASFARTFPGVRVSVQCGSLGDDVMTMVCSSALVAPTGSLAYYSGMASDNVFVVPPSLGRGYLRPNMYIVRSGGSGDDTVHHDSVRDYYDRAEMSAHLGCAES